MNSPPTFGLGTPSPYSTSPLNYVGGSPISINLMGSSSHISPYVSPLASPRLSGRRSGATSPRGSMYQSTQNAVASLPSLSGSPVSTYSASSAFLNSPVIANSGDMRMLQGGSVLGLPSLSGNQSNQGSYQQVQSYQPSEQTLQQPSNNNQSVYDFGVDNGLTLRQQQQLPAEISRYSPGTQDFIRRVQQQVPNGQFSPGTLALLQGGQPQQQLPSLHNTPQRMSGTRYTPYSPDYAAQQEPQANMGLAQLASMYNVGTQQAQLPSLHGSTSPRLSSKRSQNLASDLQALAATSSSPQMSPRLSGSGRRQSSNSLSIQALPSLSGSPQQQTGQEYGW
jgi:hypothetical protein